MSLLDDAPHTVLVRLRTRTINAEGRAVLTYVGDPIPVKCMVEPVREWSSAEEQMGQGLQFLDLAVVRSRTWPGNIDSHVIYDGVLYETSGVPQNFHVSRRTRHFRITLRHVKEV